jgi:cysteinyl-tRNA synthetase
VDDEKMSKSLGNFFTIRTVLEKYDAEVVRFFILRAHYRSPLNYSDQHLDDAKLALTRLYTALRGHERVGLPVDWSHPLAARFRDAMNDDFNTPEAMAVLFDLANEVNKTKSQDAVNLLTNLAAVLGLLERNPDEFLQGVTSGDMNVEAMIQARMIAKKNKNFAEADAIRKQLADTGIVLEDTSQGTTWRRT